MTPLAPHLTSFLRDRLAIERGASPRTCDTYAYAFKLFLEYTSRRFRRRPSDLYLEQLDASVVADFLRHLSIDRRNGPATRNARLHAIKSFMRFVEHRVPSALDQVHRILAIPTHRTERRVVRALQPDECQALLNAPTPATRLGVRDRALLHIAVAGGLRASELVGLRLDQVQFTGCYLELHVLGKGRKERVLLLWKEVASSLRRWLAVRGASDVPEVFLSARGSAITRAGLEYLVKKYTIVASREHPGLAKKRVSPHALRHTCAMNMLRGTGDTRKVALWLGHANSATTDAFYLPIDPIEKLDALASVQAPVLRQGRCRPVDDLFAALRQAARGTRSADAEKRPGRASATDDKSPSHTE